MGKICEIWNEHKVYCVANIRKSKEYHMYLKLMSKSYEIQYWKRKIRWQNCITGAFVSPPLSKNYASNIVNLFLLIHPSTIGSILIKDFTIGSITGAPVMLLMVEGWINMVICLSFLYFEFHFFDYYYCCYYYYQFDM